MRKLNPMRRLHGHLSNVLLRPKRAPDRHISTLPALPVLRREARARPGRLSRQAHARFLGEGNSSSSPASCAAGGSTRVSPFVSPRSLYVPLA